LPSRSRSNSSARSLGGASTLDGTARDFKYLVTWQIEEEDDRLGMTVEEQALNGAPDGGRGGVSQRNIVITKLERRGLASELPHAVEGLSLIRLQHGKRKEVDIANYNPRSTSRYDAVRAPRSFCLSIFTRERSLHSSTR